MMPLIITSRDWTVRQNNNRIRDKCNGEREVYFPFFYYGELSALHSVVEHGI